MQAQTKVAAANAECTQHKFAAAVSQRREAKLLDTAQKFGQLYSFEIDRLQKLYLHDMQARTQPLLLASSVAERKPSWTEWLHVDSACVHSHMPMRLPDAAALQGPWCPAWCCMSMR